MDKDDKIIQPTLKEIAEKLTDRDLFPEKVARAKEFLSNAKLLEPKKPNK